MVALERGLFLVSEVTLYDLLGVEYDPLATYGIALQGYLAHKKPRPPRTLQYM